MQEQFTLGVEEEYHLVEPDSRELRSDSHVVRAADLTGEVESEVQNTMVEIGTPICSNMAELAERLRERRFQASAAAATEDLEIVASGAHPFSRWQDQHLTDAERPRMLRALFRHVLRQQFICGMHIHVAIPADVDRIKLMNIVRGFTPHLLALSCSSPFQLGEETGFASFRSIFWRGFPFTGAPPRFESEAQYEEFLNLLLRSGTIPDRRTVYWSVRPSSRYPTLEVRTCDVCPRMADAVAIAALSRAVVVAAAQGRLTAMGSTLPAQLQDEILSENEWIAARDGLGAVLVAPEEASGSIGMREAIRRMVEAVQPTLEELGDGRAIEGIEEILLQGNASIRMRQIFAQTRDMIKVVDWLAEETRLGTGIDRRQTLRLPVEERV